MAEEKPSQVVEKPASPAPSEPDIDDMLGSIPGLKDVFGDQDKPASEQPETKGAPETEQGTPETTPQAVEEIEIPEGLKPEDEPAEAEKPKKEESDKVQKRIDELTAKRKTAEERAAALEAELNDLKSKQHAPPPVAPTAANPLADIENEKDLETRVNAVIEARAWAFEHLDGGEVSDGKGGTRWLEGAEVKALLGKAETLLYKHAPERRVFLQSKQQFDSEARREYPALFKNGSEPNKVLNQWLTVFPECRRYPDIALIIGDAIVGQSIRQNRSKSRNGKTSSASTPLAAPAPVASPRVPQSKVLSGQALTEAFKNDPDGALNSFVDTLIEGGASQRASQR